MEARKIRNESEARACLDAVSVSGLSLVAWAREHGVDGRSLNAWRMNLGRRAASDGLRLIELVPTSPRRPTSYRVRCGAFEVDAPDDFDDETLGRLLRLVASC